MRSCACFIYWGMCVVMTNGHGLLFTSSNSGLAGESSTASSGLQARGPFPRTGGSRVGAQAM